MVQIHGGLGSQPYRSLNKLPVHFMLTMGVFLLFPQHDLGHLSNHVDSETYTSSSSQFLVSMMVSYAIFCKSKETSRTLKPNRRGNSYQPSCMSYRYICTKFFLFCPPPTTLVNMSGGFSSVLTCPVNISPVATASLTAW